MKKCTPILYVEAIEPALPFWTTQLGFEKTAEVPQGERLGFVILAKDGIEIMYQTRDSVEHDDARIAQGLSMRGTILFIETDDLSGVQNALADAEVVFERRKTFYGAEEIGVREPCGNVVVFAQFGA